MRRGTRMWVRGQSREASGFRSHTSWIESQRRSEGSRDLPEQVVLATVTPALKLTQPIRQDGTMRPVARYGVARNQGEDLPGMTPDDYRKQAGECLRLANAVASGKAKLALIDMAHVWLKLADQAEKNG